MIVTAATSSVLILKVKRLVIKNITLFAFDRLENT